MGALIKNPETARSELVTGDMHDIVGDDFVLSVLPLRVGCFVGDQEAILALSDVEKPPQILSVEPLVVSTRVRGEQYKASFLRGDRSETVKKHGIRITATVDR